MKECSNNLEIDEDSPVSNQLVYQNFATKPTDSFLGTFFLIQEFPFKNKDFMWFKRKVLEFFSTLSAKTKSHIKVLSWLRKSFCLSKSRNTTSHKNIFVWNQKTKLKSETVSFKESFTHKTKEFWQQNQNNRIRSPLVKIILLMTQLNNWSWNVKLLEMRWFRGKF